MKFNKWTIGLAAVGVVSLASAAKADEKMTVVQTALSSTTISGYVDTSAQWNVGKGTGGDFYKFDTRGKSDGFNLNVVQLTVAKPLDESEWASGYRVDIWMGPDADTLATDTHFINNGNFALRQAYVALRTPVGNGIDWKMGVFDSIIGYESLESGNNPNYTRSYGHSIEPQTHTGLLGTYRFCEEVAFSAGIANTMGPQINQRAFATGVPGGGAGLPGSTESYKTYMASLAFTAPQSWGWAAGSTLYAGIVDGFNGGNLANTANAKQTSWYAGATLATPVTGLKFGAAFDYLDSGGTAAQVGGVYPNGNDIWCVGVYGSYQATEKLSFHARGELLSRNNETIAGKDNRELWSVTGTVQYDLWQNVISRLEVRWDRGDEGAYYSASHPFGQVNSILVAANIIYKF